MSIDMICTSAQPTAAKDGTVGGSRVVLVERTTSGQHGARMEIFLSAEQRDAIQLGQVKTVTIK